MSGVSAYTEALRRYQSAVAQGKDGAEVDAAARVLQRFAVDPYYDPSRERVAA